MHHQQILDKLAAKQLIQSLDEDLARLTNHAMCFHKHDSLDHQFSYILPKLLLRWNCILRAGNEVSDLYKQKTSLILAILLHKYGFADKTLTDKALQAIDELNKAVALSDDFFRKSEEIKHFLASPPLVLKRKPSISESITFYRPQDVISIQLDGKFYAAYIHKLSGPNESPIIEYYKGVFDQVPTLDELEKAPAKGQMYNDGIERIAYFAICGMKFLPDLANQIQLISACVATKPSNTHLATSVGLYCLSDLFQMQEEITGMFSQEIASAK